MALDFSKYIKQVPRCESCEFYDSEEDSCDLSLDEDEMGDFLGGSTGNCPYYRYYDEYKSVNKQI